MLKFTMACTVLALLAASAHASSDMCYERAQTQAQLNECAAIALKGADDELNALYKQMQGRLQGDSMTRGLLLDAERKWLAFRDAECRFASIRSVDGSLHAMQVNDCLTDMTRTRVIELQNHLACGRGGEQTASQCALPRAKR
ncbi:hypothetical protein CCO03_14010 [Comamonas serinivorans]|uniref:Lysozyme inhibitor LprI-like N-terminal domain-containing protein n=1 Tax=Comamonas serinivorans TaxID=1082851 RepID=A0A1Y0EQX0_9BURK|nr:lysozyme inhibitor LprI family protein [Comamonas serinivorans]ARU05652.1 hypothetical protein CCO03_14010 [Comamonas serinivorans]